MTNRFKGFTLIEVMIVIVIMGIAASAASGIANQISAFYSAERDLQNTAELRAIADAHIKYAALHNSGELLLAYDGGACNSCPINTTVVELTNYVENRTQRTAIASNYDDTTIFNVRGLMIDPNQHQTTFNLPSALNLVIDYQSGVIVQTDCQKGSDCDIQETWKTPIYNQSGWVPNPRIIKFTPFNNLEVLQNLATGTVERVIYIQHKIREYTQEMVISNPANVDSNYLPVSTHPSTPDYTMTDPTINGGCINGWYDLGHNDINVLATIGLDTNYGVTLFGGGVQYCADFDLKATDSSAANTAPHIGALRINRFITKGISPGDLSADNIIFPI